MVQMITADDVVRAGACQDGVAKVVHRIWRKMASAMAVAELLPLLDEDEQKYLLNAAELDGHGHGYGDGHGYDYGDGYGYGDGHGHGYGDGHGYGYGDGDGYGEGDGYGHGHGYGDGHGYGYGYDYGDTTGDGKY